MKTRIWIGLVSSVGLSAAIFILARTANAPYIVAILATVFLAILSYLLLAGGTEHFGTTTLGEFSGPLTIGNLAAQVAHDIRAPLSALNIVVSADASLPEERRIIIQNATRRINDIANCLLAESRRIALPTTPVAAVIEQIIVEKRFQFRGCKGLSIQCDVSAGQGLLVGIDASDLARVLSNLINNSVEALSGPGSISLKVVHDSGETLVFIRDTGRGIPPEVLSRMGVYGFSHGKRSLESGFGLGVYHARRILENSGGNLSIASAVGRGTLVVLCLPAAAAKPDRASC